MTSRREIMETNDRRPWIKASKERRVFAVHRINDSLYAEYTDNTYEWVYEATNAETEAFFAAIYGGEWVYKQYRQRVAVAAAWNRRTRE